jgi:hypothetical protein
MTESEWQRCTDPTWMLEFLRDKASQRKLRLFAVASFRRIYDLLPLERSRAVVEVLERCADGQATAADVADAKEKALTAIAAWAEVTNTSGNITATERASVAVTFDSILDMVMGAAEATAWVKVGTPEAVSEPEEQAQCDLLRDIIGNPFRTVNADPAWLMPNVVTLAWGRNDERAFARMPELADALEHAGCTNQDILDHCRQPGPHVRGCWVVDLVLGKK